MHDPGKELILKTKSFAKEIRWKSWYYTLTTFSLLVASIAGGIWFQDTLLKLLCSIFTAMLLVRFFIIFHDFQHHAILYKSIPANLIFSVFGVYMLTPPSIWKRSHDHHHNHNSKLFSASIGSFPIMTRQKFMESSESDRKMYFAIRSPLNMFFAYFTMFIYGMCLRSFLSSPRRHWDSLLTVALHLAVAVYLFINFGWLTWFLVFFLPFFISHMLGAYLFYAQHNFPGVVFKNNVEWSYSHAALESSSYMVMNPFMQWVTANIGFHHIHHLNSRIPFYRLPETMRALPELQQAKTTRLAFSEILACLRLKVWDPELNRMITMEELNGRCNTDTRAHDGEPRLAI